MCFQAPTASQMYFWSFPSKSVALNERQGFSFEGPSKWMFLVLCGWICALAGRLWDEICPLRQGWTLMDRTQIWPRPQRDWRGSVLQLLLKDNVLQTQEESGLLLLDWWTLITSKNLSEPCLSHKRPPPPVQTVCHRQGKGTRKWCSTLHHRRHIHHYFTSKSLWQTAPEASIISGHAVLLPLLLHIWGLTVI